MEAIAAAQRDASGPSGQASRCPPWVKLTPGPKGAVRYRLSDIEDWERKMELFQQPEQPEKEDDCGKD